MPVDWRFLPRFLIRGTGFAIDLLDGLRMPESERGGLEVAALTAELDREQARFASDLFPRALQLEQQRGASPEIFREWYALNHAVRKRQACPVERRNTLAERSADVAPWIDAWNGTLSAALAARTSLERSVERELVFSRERLHELAGDPRFQEALLLSNPDVYAVAVPSYFKHFQRDARPAKVRYLERQLFAYLQRFCAKNDTTSFFGPIDYGEFSPHATDPLIFEQQWSGGARWTRLSYWAAQALADTIARDPVVRKQLQPRVAPGLLLTPDGLVNTVNNQPVSIVSEELALLRRIEAAQGEQTAAEVCQDGWTQLEHLVQRGLVTLALQIPTSEFDPLGWLRAQAERLPVDQWRCHLDAIQARLSRFEAAAAPDKLQVLRELETEFTALTGQSPRRGQGATYADRLVLYDEARGEVSRCTVGQAAANDLLSRLQPSVDLCVSYSTVVQEVCRRRARALFNTSGGTAPVPYLAFARAVESELSLQSCLADPAVTAFLDALNCAARAAFNGDEVCLSTADVQHLLRPVPPGSLISPDIFLAASDAEHVRSGDYEVVIGEIHYGAQVWCHFLAFDDERAALGDAITELVGAHSNGRVRANLVHRRQQGKTFPLELPGVSVEVRGRSARQDGCVLPIADLEVVDGPDGLALRSRSRGILLDLYPGDPRAISNWLFGTPPTLTPPIRLGRHTPRVSVGGAVLSRARWEVAASEFVPPGAHPDSTDLIAHACALRHRHGLPGRCFARVASERKPLFVDFGNVFSLELLLTVVRDNAVVELTELLPASHNWWLRREDGAHSSEWRTTLVAVNSHE